MKFRLLFCTMFFSFLVATSLQAAPISFTESFSNAGSLPGPFLEQAVGGTAATFDGSDATFPGLGGGGEGRSYLRTIADDYSLVSFIAEITVTMFDGTLSGGDGVAFFGMGVGDRSGFFFEPRVGPHLFVRPSPDNFTAGSVAVVDQSVDTSFVGDLSGTGTHRLQMSWDAGLEQMTFAIHQDYAGGLFVASSTFGPFDGSNNGFDATNSRIFFGGMNGETFDDLTVIVPEPSTFALAALGLLGMGYFRRNRT